MTTDNGQNPTSKPRHPAEMELDEIERLLDEHMGPRWRGFRGPADALGVLLHEMEENAHAGWSTLPPIRIEEMAARTDQAPWLIARAMARLIRRGHLDVIGGTPDEAIADLQRKYGPAVNGN